MANDGGSTDYHIVPTEDSHRFLFRARLADESNINLCASTAVAGRECKAYYVANRKQIVLGLNVCPPIPDGAAKISAHMVLLDKTGSPAPSIGTVQLVTELSPNLTTQVTGCILVAVRDDAFKANCEVDDGYVVVLCTVDVTWKKDSATPPEMLPGLGHDLAAMFGKRDLTDVSFDVGGETFDAHRLVLAARSPVFRAELYGPMAESKMTSITIQDMDASTFRSLLHYMYHGSLPAAGQKDVTSTMAQCQHLLVAADRYGVEGLKKICEDNLCSNTDGITIQGVVSMLELAEAHICPKLKSRCFDFLADSDNFKMVATSAEYLHLMLSFPALLVEARERLFKLAPEKTTIMEEPPLKRTRLN